MVQWGDAHLVRLLHMYKSETMAAYHYLPTDIDL